MLLLFSPALRILSLFTGTGLLGMLVGVSGPATTLSPLLTDVSSDTFALPIDVPGSKGRGTSGGVVHRISAQFTPAKGDDEYKIVLMEHENITGARTS